MGLCQCRHSLRRSSRRNEQRRRAEDGGLEDGGVGRGGGEAEARPLSARRGPCCIEAKQTQRAFHPPPTPCATARSVPPVRDCRFTRGRDRDGCSEGGPRIALPKGDDDDDDDGGFGESPDNNQPPHRRRGRQPDKGEPGVEWWGPRQHKRSVRRGGWQRGVQRQQK